MLVDVTGPRLSLCKADLNIQVVLQIDFVYSLVFFILIAFYLYELKTH